METVTQVWERGNRQETGSGKARELRARIDDSLDALARAVDDVRASDTFKAYLDVQAKFHRYSWHNSLLIAMQRPEASQVAGYRKWQELGRQVRKGGKGITIFAPCLWKREVADDTIGVKVEQGIFFKAVYVFDIGQTDGPELPSLDVPDVDAAADALLADLRRVADSRGIRVAFGPLSGGVYGLSKGGAVDIDDTRGTGQQAKTLAHELAHEALHKSKESLATMPERSRSIAELEAEAVAYVVCRHFGLDVEVRASRYIALWDGDSKALRASLERIADTARTMIDDVEAPAARKAVA
jgi:antirestriction protein ArdC